MKIPLVLLTGFLGSGKTTFLNAALSHPGLTNTAVVVNEFGEIALDHALLSQAADSVYLLHDGCMCCSIKGELVETLCSLHAQRLAGSVPSFDKMVIETSGIADPSVIADALFCEPRLRSLYSLVGTITMVDAVNASATFAAHDQSLRQVALANVIILTKGELAEDTSGLRRELAHLNPEAQILDPDLPSAGAMLTAQFGRELPTVNMPVVPAATVGAVHAHIDHQDHAHGQRIHHFAIIREQPWSERTLQLFLEALTANAGPQLLRVKGLVNVAESPGRPALIHGAQKVMHNLCWLAEWPDNDRRTRIVFITMDTNEEEIQSLTNYIENFSARSVRNRA